MLVLKEQEKESRLPSCKIRDLIENREGQGRRAVERPRAHVSSQLKLGGERGEKILSRVVLSREIKAREMSEISSDARVCPKYTRDVQKQSDGSAEKWKIIISPASFQFGNARISIRPFSSNAGYHRRC